MISGKRFLSCYRIVLADACDRLALLRRDGRAVFNGLTEATMPRRFLVFIVALVALALTIAFFFVGSGATKNTVPMQEGNIPTTTR